MNFELARRVNEWFLLDLQALNYPGVDMMLVTGTAFVGIRVIIVKGRPPPWRVGAEDAH